MTNQGTILYSGGLKGSESVFGECAAEFGLDEVNFTFDGHNPFRTQNQTLLSDAELEKGNISMEIVSERMGRRYAKAERIRKVFQLIFHMVIKGYQVFAIGWIQEDGTVKGGTGWGVELAKFFNRPVSVFDQEKNAWFSWEMNQWKEDEPTICHDTFCGTGTRNLTADGDKAIRDLFARSFK